MARIAAKNAGIALARFPQNRPAGGNAVSIFYLLLPVLLGLGLGTVVALRVAPIE